MVMTGSTVEVSSMRVVIGSFSAFGERPVSWWKGPPAAGASCMYSEGVEAAIPEASVLFDPVSNGFERRRLEAARPPLPLLSPRNEASGFQHLEMLGDGRLTHLVWRSQLFDRDLAAGEPREDRPACRIGQGEERDAEGIGRHQPPG